MRKYKLVIYLLILSFLFFPWQVIHGQTVTTGDANAFSCTENLVGNTGYLPWFNENCITPSVTPCPSTTVTPTPTTCPTKTFTCSQCQDLDHDNRDMYSYCKNTYNCGYNDEKWSCDCPAATPTPTVTPTPTQTPSNPGNPGGPGDGRSDGRSDGLSSCPSCTQAPASQAIKAVLGLSTTSGSESGLIQWAELLGALVLTSAGAIFLKKNA